MIVVKHLRGGVQRRHRNPQFGAARDDLVSGLVGEQLLNARADGGPVTMPHPHLVQRGIAELRRVTHPAHQRPPLLGRADEHTHVPVSTRNDRIEETQVGTTGRLLGKPATPAGRAAHAKSGVKILYRQVQQGAVDVVTLPGAARPVVGQQCRECAVNGRGLAAQFARRQQGLAVGCSRASQNRATSPAVPPHWRASRDTGRSARSR